MARVTQVAAAVAHLAKQNAVQMMGTPAVEIAEEGGRGGGGGGVVVCQKNRQPAPQKEKTPPT
jgi:hypothetical protein